MPLAVVVETPWQAAALAPWASRFAAALGGEPVLFVVTSAAKGKKKAEARRAAASAEKKKPASKAAKEAVADAAAAVKAKVEEAVEAADAGTDSGADATAAGSGGSPPADREPASPLEAAVRGAMEAAGFGVGEDAPTAEVAVVEVGPGGSADEPRAGLEDLLDALEAHATDFVLLAATESARGDDPLTTRVFRAARCAVVVLRPPPGRTAEREEGNPSPADAGGRVLVPTAGGPHAALALRLAKGLQRHPAADGFEGFSGVDALYVQKDVGYESRGLAQRKVRAAVRRALGGPLGIANGAEAAVGEVIRVGLGYPKALAEVVGEGRHGLVMVGAADRVQAKRALFGGLPDAILKDAGEGDRGVTIAVVRDAESVTDTAGRVARNMVRRYVPQLDREDRISLVERIEGPSRWSFDFVTLMVLSTSIATFGEMQDSTAVVIGAMLVAPLMTPLVGCGLAVVQGNNQLVRGSVRSVALGFLVAFGVALAMGLFIPFPGLTSEVLARGRPTLLDLGVAFISGVAAAYAVARPNLSGALPGVAIAAALVPPIAAAGLAFSAGDWRVGGGATLLFFVNVLAIILGAAIALLAVGVEGRHEHKSGGHWRPHAFGVLVMGCLILAVPLTWSLLQAMPPEGLPPRVESNLAEVLAGDGNAQLISAEGPFPRDGGGLRVEVRRRASAPPRTGLADELAAELAEHYGDSVTVNVTTELTQASGQSATAD
ncbi:DUF389 domain-containing protein [Phycisphaera mikurensis]|uniref:TIGR00341 family protein n=1 Tax=Phycisphaera mikurensis (strain NBRC 102666 / KCTC 22515 / FYK2301M01) TaxID=1142394 RepID=I0IHU9_PHYMF|nr:DUF389 domain-containing protein [Phycisphaera mikurensis]MBB6441079.1 putative hydrophobic protein (TIGR00271 family) [Phycisphaera mikurensis]BAM04837.1 hypothetical protein PSMK_26780 [Phycisphaera mikurensis NBRC 102666]